MSNTCNEEIAQRIVDAMNRKDIDLISQTLSEDLDYQLCPESLSQAGGMSSKWSKATLLQNMQQMLSGMDTPNVSFETV